MKPTMLIGTSGVPGTFTESMIREMAEHVERPVVFPLSNPTDKTEAHAADVVEWTDGRCLIATGSPFDPVQYGDRTIHISQGNNVYIFPGVGLGVLAAKATRVTDSMFTAAASDLAEQVSAEDLAAGKLYPPLADMRKTTRSIARAVARQAFEEGLAQADPDTPVEDLVNELVWEPEYPRLDPE
jgi:malate dehydrogenase (oxaloacetate-decarboxylating)